MPATDTSENGLESLIVAALTGASDAPNLTAAHDASRPATAHYYFQGHPQDYDREHCLDLLQLCAFLSATQPEVVREFALTQDGPKRRQFLARLQGEIAKRGVVDVLRHGIKHGPAHVDLFYATPSPGNPKAAQRFAANRFSVTRQLRYSTDDAQRALDLCIFVNGLPLATFELKNSLTKQTVEDAIQQYRLDRNPREPLFAFGRCLVHFAVDDHEVRFSTSLKGRESWFLPFNKGWNDGAGNPPNPAGLKTDYLWRQFLARTALTDILENYAQIIEKTDQRTGRKRRDQVFPRYHQLDLVRALLAHVRQVGVGHRYLVQHSAGSGKSNSIAWLAHQLIELTTAATSSPTGVGDAPRPSDGRGWPAGPGEGQGEVASRSSHLPAQQPLFDSVIVVTDRKVLDRQIRDTIKQFAQVSAVVGHAEHSGDRRNFLADGKKIIITTVQKFPFILDEIGSEHRHRKFAIIIDEAHSSQGGRAAAQMNIALSPNGAEAEEETVEDTINRIIEARKMLPNASYFAFTATPKNKTLEVFGEPFTVADKVKHRPFHSYTMRQAIEEGFILDVLKNYTPVESYYRLLKRIEADPEFDVRKAQKKLRRYVESHERAIHDKAEIMVDHFLTQVIGQQKIGGTARAMVVTGGIERAIQYYHAISNCLKERNSAFRALVAFSGEHEYAGVKVTEASLNGFPSGDIPDTFAAEEVKGIPQRHPYRFLICADKFQTGYDEPLLHTMYVDKDLSGIKAVQTLSRLNRAHPKKHDTFILDFQNDADTIKAAFDPYYRTTILSEETDPNRLHDLVARLEARQIYTPDQVQRFVALYLGDAERPQLDAILDGCVARYKAELDEDGQVDFKGTAKGFVRTYGFLASILPFKAPAWEKLSIFLNFLIPKLPAPIEVDLSKGILEAIDMESYRAEVQATINIGLAEQTPEIGPVPTSGGGHLPEPELDRLTNILRAFNEQFGNIDWRDSDQIRRVITEDIPTKVSADRAYQNAMKHADKKAARIEHDYALGRAILDLLADHTELYKQFHENPSFRKWLADTIFGLTYRQEPE